MYLIANTLGTKIDFAETFFSIECNIERSKENTAWCRYCKQNTETWWRVLHCLVTGSLVLGCVILSVCVFLE